MGIVESRYPQSSIFPQQSRQINQRQFSVIPNYSYTHQADPCYGSNFVVLAHKQKPNLELEKYQLFFNTYEEFKTYEEVYQWRNKSKYLVQAKAIKERANNRMCGNFYEAVVFIQRIPIRACEITDVPLDQGLYLMYSCFMGFRKVFERTGYFDITLDMICVNKEALVKIWLNSNLSKIYPEFYTIDQNFNESEFIHKLLEVCQSLIDYSSIDEKFSDFLKGCCFSYHQTPKRQSENKFCKYTKFREFENPSAKKQTEFSLNFLSFDKAIEYFEAYLSKHKLVVARQMKSVRDLFRIQQKIEHHGSQSQKNQPDQKQKEMKKLLKIDSLQFYDGKAKRKPQQSNRQNTKRVGSKMPSYRNQQYDLSTFCQYKSEQFPRNIKNLKQPEFKVKQRAPSISFVYQPLSTSRTAIHNAFSPPHLTHTGKQFYVHSRNRIKTEMSPNVTFSIRPRNADDECNLSPNHSYKSAQNFFRKDKQIINVDLHTKENEQLRRQNSPQNVETQKNKKTFEIHASNNLMKENQPNRQKLSKIETNTKVKVYCSAEKQVQIDEQIIKDLHKFDIFHQQNGE